MEDNIFKLYKASCPGYRKNSFSSTMKRRKRSHNAGKGFDGHFSREDTPVADKHGKGCSGTPLAVQGLGLQAPSTGRAGSIPGWGTRIPHATQHSQKKGWSTSQVIIKSKTTERYYLTYTRTGVINSVDNNMCGQGCEVCTFLPHTENVKWFSCLEENSAVLQNVESHHKI